MTAIEETIYTDGSGASCLYIVYGIKIAATRNHEGRVMVFPVDPSACRKHGKGAVHSACRAVESRVKGLPCPAWVE